MGTRARARPARGKGELEEVAGAFRCSAAGLGVPGAGVTEPK